MGLILDIQIIDRKQFYLEYPSSPDLIYQLKDCKVIYGNIKIPNKIKLYNINLQMKLDWSYVDDPRESIEIYRAIRNTLLVRLLLNGIVDNQKLKESLNDEIGKNLIERLKNNQASNIEKKIALNYLKELAEETRQELGRVSWESNATLLVSRMSNMLQAPFLGGMVDTAILRGSTQMLVSNFRMIIFAAFIGNLIGAILSPFFVNVYAKAITRFDTVGSVPRLIVQAFRPRNIKAILKAVRLPSRLSFRDLSLKNIPKTFLVLNVLMVSIYAIGVLASMLAGAMIPEYRVTATQLSAIVNGIATILLTLMVDPTAALITDQAARGKRPESDVRSMVFYLILGRVVGTLLISQLILLPSANYIEATTHLVKTMFGR